MKLYRYICLHCFHEWDSINTRSVLRCSNCHRNQGINYKKFRQAVDAAKTALRKVAASPPPHHPPLDVIGLIPKALGPVLEVAENEFPRLNVPLNFIKEILQLAHKELEEEALRQQQEPPLLKE